MPLNKTAKTFLTISLLLVAVAAGVLWYLSEIPKPISKYNQKMLTVFIL